MSRRPAPDSPAERELVRHLTEAYATGDVNAIISLLAEDVWLTMPPAPFEYQGRDVAGRALSLLFGRGLRYRLVATRANGQPAFGIYVNDPRSGVLHANGLMVLTLAGRPDQRAHPLRQQQPGPLRPAPHPRRLTSSHVPRQPLSPGASHARISLPPEFSRRRLLLSGLAAIPAATVLAATAARPGTALAASTRAPRPAWPAAAARRTPARLFLLTSPYRSQEKEKSCS